MFRRTGNDQPLKTSPPETTEPKKESPIEPKLNFGLYSKIVEKKFGKCGRFIPQRQKQNPPLWVQKILPSPLGADFGSVAANSIRQGIFLRCIPYANTLHPTFGNSWIGNLTTSSTTDTASNLAWEVAEFVANTPAATLSLDGVKIG